MTSPRKSRSLKVTIAAACMLVLQSAAAAFAIGNAAGAVPLDAFGNPLCITSSEQTSQDGKSGTHGDRLHQCWLACAVGMVAAPTPDEALAAAWPKILSAAPVRPFSDAYAVWRDRHPARPRAPPVML